MGQSHNTQVADKNRRTNLSTQSLDPNSSNSILISTQDASETKYTPPGYMNGSTQETNSTEMMTSRSNL